MTPLAPDLGRAEGAALRDGLLEIASGLFPERAPVVVREWDDLVRFREEEIGRRPVVVIAVAGDGTAGFEDVRDAVEAAGWRLNSRWNPAADPRDDTASRDGCHLMINEADGGGLLTFAAWTPVVFDDPGWRQPSYTRSTVNGKLCPGRGRRTSRSAVRRHLQGLRQGACLFVRAPEPG
ncbi:hypothetical protein [Actinomadura rupiterrae]|uniref:hypothetical protein n=1 Tax=Actinomadura rupiterrae TaxID=559627 RepID=UPI0020A59553|nr:hypothetical protein [Actinomadura rupiterrae]MCP2335345.1 hypothetical protein [Actinomadura rupiterrae]